MMGATTYVLTKDLTVSSLDVLQAATDGGDLVLNGFRLWVKGPVIVGVDPDPVEVDRVRLALDVCPPLS